MNISKLNLSRVYNLVVVFMTTYVNKPYDQMP